MTKEALEQMRSQDVRTVDRSTLADCRKVIIDAGASREERIRSYLRQIKNPYCYLHGDTVVKISFMDTGVTLEDRLEEYARNL